MSVYGCIDKIDALLKNEESKKIFGLGFRFKSWRITPRAQEFLEEIKRGLEAYDDAAQKDEYLKELSQKMDGWLGKNLQSNKLVFPLLEEIKSDLRSILTPTPAPAITSKNPALNSAYERLMDSVAHVRSIKQVEMKELGRSQGECYGFAMMMADPSLNKADIPIVFGKAVHNYQKHQHDRQLDQTKFTSTRLRGTRFCPSFQKQAEELMAVASLNEGAHLRVDLFSAQEGHSCYLRKTESGKIHFMDSNHGDFIFGTDAEFIAAFRVMQMMSSQRSQPITFTSYGVIKFEEHLNQHKESITWGGKLRSFLTGVKYTDEQSRKGYLRAGGSVGAIAGGYGGYVIGGLIGATLGSIVPVVGTAIGGVIGMAIGSLWGLVEGYLAGKFVTEKVSNVGVLGFLRALSPREWIYSKYKQVRGLKDMNDEVPELRLQAKSTGLMPASRPKVVRCPSPEVLASVVDTRKRFDELSAQASGVVNPSHSKAPTANGDKPGENEPGEDRPGLF